MAFKLTLRDAQGADVTLTKEQFDFVKPDIEQMMQNAMDFGPTEERRQLELGAIEKLKTAGLL